MRPTVPGPVRDAKKCILKRLTGAQGNHSVAMEMRQKLSNQSTGEMRGEGQEVPQELRQLVSAVWGTGGNTGPRVR